MKRGLTLCYSHYLLQPLVLILILLLLLCFCRPAAAAYTCFGIDSTSYDVCNSRGTCIKQDTCSCDTGRKGSDCSDLDCSWISEASGSLGAAVPDFKVQVRDGWVLLAVMMKRDRSILHRVSLSEASSCNFGDEDVVPNDKWQLDESNGCYVRYVMNRTLVEHLNDTRVSTVMLDSASFQGRFYIYADYMEYSSFSQSGCKMTSFRSAKTVNMAFQSISSIPFASLNETVTDDGKLQVAADLSFTTVGRPFEFNVSQSIMNGYVNFTAVGKLMNSSCGGEDNKCKYNVFVSLQIDNSLYVGRFYFSANLNSIVEAFQLQSISNLIQSIATTSLSAASGIVQLVSSSRFFCDSWNQRPQEFKHTDRVQIVTEIPFALPHRSLVYKNVHVCCMKDGAHVPRYDPVEAKFGCQKKTLEMTSWAAVVVNEVIIPNTNFSVEMVKFGVDNRIGMSLNLEPVSSKEKRICYVQLETMLKAKPAAKRRSSDSDLLEEEAVAGGEANSAVNQTVVAEPTVPSSRTAVAFGEVR